MVRTQIVINDQLMQEAMSVGRYKTKRETVQAALELLAKVCGQTKIRQFRGKLHWQGNLYRMRSDK